MTDDFAFGQRTIEVLYGGRVQMVTSYFIGHLNSMCPPGGSCFDPEAAPVNLRVPGRIGVWFHRDGNLEFAHLTLDADPTEIYRLDNGRWTVV